MKASVIVLNYNGAKFICELFRSLSEQTFKDFEVIFVDNCSTDASVEILKEYLDRKLPKALNVEIICNTKNYGFCKGNNIGLMKAKGESVIFLNNDTYLSSTWLETLVSLMDSYPKIGAAQSLIVTPSGELNNAGTMRDIYGWGNAIIPKNPNCKIIIGSFQLMGASMIVRRKVLDVCGAFDEKLSYGDHDLSLRIVLKGYDVATAVQSICYHYGSVSIKKVFKVEKREYERCAERIRIMLKYYPRKKLLTIFPTSFMIMSLENIYYSIVYKKPLVLLPATAIFRNLVNLPEILVLRRDNQTAREINFKALDGKWLTHYPLLAVVFLSISH